MLNKLQLCRKAEEAGYFKKEDVSTVYATTDGQFFHAESRSYADSHASTIPEATVIQINKGDLKVEEAAEEVRLKDKEEAAIAAGEEAKKNKSKKTSKPAEKAIKEMSADELTEKVKSLEGITKDEIEMVLEMKPEKIISFIEGYKAPKK